MTTYLIVCNLKFNMVIRLPNYHSKLRVNHTVFVEKKVYSTQLITPQYPNISWS